jgi:hemolysin activation/secretion protein
VSATGRARLPGGLDLTGSGWAGAGGGDRIPQRQFRLGGLKTLRGYPAGSLRGASAWAFGLDLGLTRKTLTPVVFADVGQVAPRGLRFAGDPAFSLGAGVSLLDGLLRLDAARPVAPRASWIVTLVMGARR